MRYLSLHLGGYGGRAHDLWTVEVKDIQGITPLFSEQEIALRVAELARQLSQDYEGCEPLMIGVLSGACMFLADLARAVDLPVTIDFIKAHSYAGQQTTGSLTMTLDCKYELAGRDVILVEDIVDTGLTMRSLMDNLNARQPKSLKTCSLLYKPDSNAVRVDYYGFQIGQEFVVGYGLDLDGKYRDLPYIGKLESALV